VQRMRFDDVGSGLEALEARLAVHLGACDAALLDRQTRLLEKTRLPVRLAGLRHPPAPEAIAAAMTHDKKARAGRRAADRGDGGLPGRSQVPVGLPRRHRRPQRGACWRYAPCRLRDVAGPGHLHPGDGRRLPGAGHLPGSRPGGGHIPTSSGHVGRAPPFGAVTACMSGVHWIWRRCAGRPAFLSGPTTSLPSPRAVGIPVRLRSVTYRHCPFVA